MAWPSPRIAWTPEPGRRGRRSRGPELDLALSAEGVAAAGQVLDTVALNLDGHLSEHRLTLDVDGPAEGQLSSLNLALEGAMDRERQRYSGRLTPLEAETEYGRLALDDAWFSMPISPRARWTYSRSACVATKAVVCVSKRRCRHHPRRAGPCSPSASCPWT